MKRDTRGLVKIELFKPDLGTWSGNVDNGLRGQIDWKPPAEDKNWIETGAGSFLELNMSGTCMIVYKKRMIVLPRQKRSGSS